MNLILLCGIPNSGKTTKATSIAEETGYTLVRYDDYSHLIKDHHAYEIVDIVQKEVADKLNSGQNVVYDAVNRTKAKRMELLSMCKGHHCTCVYMDTPTEICVERDNSKVGWSALFAQIFEVPTEDEGFDKFIICHDGDE